MTHTIELLLEAKQEHLPKHVSIVVEVAEGERFMALAATPYLPTYLTLTAVDGRFLVIRAGDIVVASLYDTPEAPARVALTADDIADLEAA